MTPVFLLTNSTCHFRTGTIKVSNGRKNKYHVGPTLLINNACEQYFLKFDQVIQVLIKYDLVSNLTKISQTVDRNILTRFHENHMKNITSNCNKVFPEFGKTTKKQLLLRIYHNSSPLGTACSLAHLSPRVLKSNLFEINKEKVVNKDLCFYLPHSQQREVQLPPLHQHRHQADLWKWLIPQIKFNFFILNLISIFAKFHAK